MRKNKILISLDEYEAIKGNIQTVEEAFRAGQAVAFAWIADCLDVSLAFDGMEGVLRKIESGRRLKDE